MSYLRVWRRAPTNGEFSIGAGFYLPNPSPLSLLRFPLFGLSNSRVELDLPAGSFKASCGGMAGRRPRSAPCIRELSILEGENNRSALHPLGVSALKQRIAPESPSNPPPPAPVPFLISLYKLIT